MSDEDVLDSLFLRLTDELGRVREEIEQRQAVIMQRVQHVHREREELARERAELDEEAALLDRHEAEQEGREAALSALKLEIGSARHGCCCCPRPDTKGELNVTGELTIGRVDALQAVRVYGAGSDDLNDVYLRAIIHGDIVFQSADGKVVYHNGEAWCIGEALHGSQCYLKPHEDEATLPFAGFEVRDGDHPPPLLEPVDG